MDSYSDSSIVSELAAFAAGEHKEDEAPWVDDGTLEALEAQGKSISSKRNLGLRNSRPRQVSSQPGYSQADLGHPEGVAVASPARAAA